jgi:adenosylcobyric acid synthase
MKFIWGRQNGFQVLLCNDNDGCVSEDKHIMGTYLHGFFDTPEILKKWLEHIGVKDLKISTVYGLSARSREYDRLAEHVRTNVDLQQIFNLMAL